MMAYQMNQAIQDCRDIVLPRLRDVAKRGLWTAHNVTIAENCRDLIDAAARCLSEEGDPLVFEEESLCVIDALALVNTALRCRPFSRVFLERAADALARLEEIGGAA